MLLRQSRHRRLHRDRTRIVSEHTTLIALPVKKRTGSSFVGRALAGLGAVLVALFLAQNAGLVRCPLNDVPAAEKAELRRLWNLEAQAHEADFALWAHQRDEHEAEARAWALEREEWVRQRAEWETERAEEERHRLEVMRRSQGVYWTEPAGDHRCHSYGTRTYTAYLRGIPEGLNWLEVCDNMPPVVVHGRELSKPDKCERNGRGEVEGVWYVDFDEPNCKPHWDNMHERGCVPARPGYIRYEARLNGIQDKDDWEMMCGTAPATIEHTHYNRPTHCENRVRLRLFSRVAKCSLCGMLGYVWRHGRYLGPPHLKLVVPLRRQLIVAAHLRLSLKCHCQILLHDFEPF
ncbi:hypothetical protein C8Q73DRAFT_638856 [Cubamyces lactineus]|nr:hypothetical protein C8Q73DRAFT_638856 [Cubamyces lactineus]